MAPQSASTSSRAAAVAEPFHRRTVLWLDGKKIWRQPFSHSHYTASYYVERLEPVSVTKAYPVVLIHGDFHTGQVSCISRGTPNSRMQAD
jgi:hypothetical protein